MSYDFYIVLHEQYRHDRVKKIKALQKLKEIVDSKRHELLKKKEQLQIQKTRLDWFKITDSPDGWMDGSQNSQQFKRNIVIKKCF